MKVSDTLYLAADLIEERGWVQGDQGWGEQYGSGLCLEGGIIAALGINASDTLTIRGREAFRACPAYAAVSAYLDEWWSLFSWNDRSSRTADEVIGVLRAAAVVAAASETTVQVQVTA